ncbi:haloacid dehalogenase type II [Agrococcus baldri]|uniref:Haloacid dehalogenase n=1 Tax=Agrococcus baldri TaxID=153730 RepID=A0AA87RD57_9MICO|nr:haloacid dehalogenase type II [Agrococcus baldri]GEK80616.1 haloacid dehalogenase [Agrococcus baldri]
MTIDLTAYDALSFDCYGTLIDWEAGIAAVVGPWARRFDGSITDEDALVAYAEHEAAVEREAPATPYPEVLREAFRRTGAALGLEVTEADADALGRSVPAWPAFDDSAEALRRLQQRYRLIILSNVDREGFAGSNRRLGVTFDEILTAEDIGSYKPNPANFTALLQRADEIGASGRLLHVAQSLFHDHLPARAAGLPSVWINRRHAQPGWGATPDPRAAVTPDAEFPSMAAFADAVDEAWARRR